MTHEWEFYPSQVDDEPASFLVNLTYHDVAPMEGASDLTWVIVPLKHPREDGLSAAEELDDLCRIDDALTGALEGCELENYYVGGYTSGGFRRFYFYSSNGQAVECILSQAMVPIPEYEFQTGHEYQPDWSTYFDFLSPSPREARLISNRKVIDVLEENNDPLTVPRDVMHWIYFNDAETRQQFLSRSLELGFAVDHKIDPESDDEKWGIVLIRQDSVDFWSMADVTLPLFDLAIELGGNYDGWETNVLSSDLPEETI